MGEDLWIADMCITGTETKLSALQTSSSINNKKNLIELRVEKYFQAL